MWFVQFQLHVWNALEVPSPQLHVHTPQIRILFMNLVTTPASISTI